MSRDPDSHWLVLNQVGVQERIRDWLQNCADGAALVWDEDRSSESEIHFYAYDEDSYGNGNEKTKPPEISDEMWHATKQLGWAFQFNTLDDRLHIVVRGPDASQSRKLLNTFNQQQKILMSITWNVYFCVMGVILAFLAFCYSISALHEHWHLYESPHETMFETLFQLFIYFGDAIRSSIWRSKTDL